MRHDPKGGAIDQAGGELGFSFAQFTKGFDEHIRQSIRGYADLLSDCVALSEYCVENGTVVLDIGCSTGSFLAEIWSKNHERCPEANYIGIDVETNFGRYWKEMKLDKVSLQVADVRSFPIPNCCSFVTSIFSLQFISERERQAIIDQIYRALVPGGALIVAEKTFSKLSKLNDMLSSIHYDFKRQSFTEAEILAKERSLRSIMKLWSEDQILQSIAAAGFAPANVQCFWRNHSFASFIALR
jgi:tRNA (cmo5U34)-methyltransferase